MAESIIPVADLQRFGEDCLVAVGCGREHAAAHIAVLVEADKRGHYSHGFNRLRGHYVADIRSKVQQTAGRRSIEVCSVVAIFRP